MEKAIKHGIILFGFIALAAVIVCSMTACGDGGGGGDPDLSGTITISPTNNVTTGAELTATYTGSETVSYQWKKDGTNVGTNSKNYTPTEAGSYTVMVSAADFKSKTSAVVTVTGSSLSILSGNITISPNTDVTTGAELTATYTGNEMVSYQWKKDETNVVSNSKNYTPAEAGSYTVTVSAAGYNSKTSAAVTVTGSSGSNTPNYDMTGTYTFTVNSQNRTWVFNANGTYEITGYGIVGTKTGTWSSTGNDITISYATSGGGAISGSEVFTVQKSGEQVILSLKDSSVQASLLLVSLGLAANSVSLTKTGNNNGNGNGNSSEGVQGADLAAKLAWIKANAQSNATYLVTVDKNEQLGYTNLSYTGKSNITVQLQGTGGEKIVTSSSDCLFKVYDGVTLILDKDITLLKGYVDVRDNGALVMKTGAKISGSTTSYYGGGGVYVGREGTFTMSGGEISGNNSGTNSGGGVYVGREGTFTMSGGEISGNNSGTRNGGGVYVAGTFTMSGGEISGNNSGNNGGGVYVASGSSYIGNLYPAGIFTMTGGEILRNTSFNSGGGVYVDRGAYGYVDNWTTAGTFTKSGGTIMGYSSDTVNGNVVKQYGTIQSLSGHAVLVYYQSYSGPNTISRRETTAGPTVNLYSTYTGSAGGWEN